MEATAKVSDRSLARVYRTIDSVAKNTQRETGEVIIQLMILSIQSAAVATKQSKALRKVVDLRRRKGRKRPGWAVEIFHGQGQRTMFYTEDRAKKERVKRIARRGLAKNVWTSTIGFLPGGRRLSAGAIPAGTSSGGVTRQAGFVRSAIAENKLRYIAKIAPHSAAKGLRNGLTRLRKDGKRRIANAAVRGAN